MLTLRVAHVLTLRFCVIKLVTLWYANVVFILSECLKRTLRWKNTMIDVTPNYIYQYLDKIYEVC